MPSFEMTYDEEEDALEVYFATFDEFFARTIPLNDNIVLYTDTAFSVVWGVAFYDYRRLLEVSETHLDGLRAVPEPERNRLLTLFTQSPANLFIELLETENLRALVKAPALQDLISG